MWGSLNSMSIFFKTALLHVTDTKKMILSPVDNKKCPCLMSLTVVLGPMLPVKLKKSPRLLSLRWLCRMSILRNAPVAMWN